ncbi:hypothetical protein DL93DRAFT_2170244 [Clavulina sp. PMI_390]|nr:hypothetical protein DL93DRAFT_2170244 [Clavulina sp. PMI_390]
MPPSNNASDANIPPTSRLPLELYAEIFEYLDNPSGVSMLQTCRSIHLLCQYVHYRSIDIYSPTLYQAVLRGSLLLATLLERPDLATAVKELTVGGMRSSRLNQTDNLSSNYSENEFREALGLHHHSINHIPITFPTLKLGHPTLTTQYSLSHEFWLLLDLLPNLVILNLPIRGPMAMSLAFAALGMTTLDKPAALRHAQTLNLRRSSDDSSGGSARDFVALFSLPDLKTLRVSGIADMGPDWRWEYFLEEQLWEHGESSVENLHFKHCDFGPNLLATLLVLPRALRTLFYTQARKSTRHTPFGFDWDAFSSALRTHTTTITSIDISTVTTHGHSIIIETIGTLESLREFLVLREVRLPARALLGPARESSPSDTDSPPSDPASLSLALPMSLVTLEIRLNWPWNLRYFMDRTSCPEGWPSEKRHLPALESFILRRIGGDDAARKAGKEVIDAFANAGIEVIPPLGNQAG